MALTRPRPRPLRRAGRRLLLAVALARVDQVLEPALRRVPGRLAAAGRRERREARGAGARGKARRRARAAPRRWHRARGAAAAAPTAVACARRRLAAVRSPRREPGPQRTWARFFGGGRDGGSRIPLVGARHGRRASRRPRCCHREARWPDVPGGGLCIRRYRTRTSGSARCGRDVARARRRGLSRRWSRPAFVRRWCPRPQPRGRRSPAEAVRTRPAEWPGLCRLAGPRAGGGPSGASSRS